MFRSEGEPRRSRLARAGSAVALAGLFSAVAAAAPRVVAVGDVHGDLTAFRAILKDAGLVDDHGAWTGGEAVLVQTGDLIDRGPSTRGVLDFVMALEKDAAKSGGSVVVLLGNHEVMNMTGDLRYVPPESYAEFADAGSEKRREDAWRTLGEYAARRASELHRPGTRLGPDEKGAWLEKHPPGYFERQEAFGSDGVYGRWLREKSAVLVLGDAAFLHGGISPAYVRTPLPEIDRLVRSDLVTFDGERKQFVAEGLILPFFDFVETTRAVREQLDALGVAGKDPERRKTYEKFLDWSHWTMNAEDGPLWFRGYARWTEAEGDKELSSLTAFDLVEHFVVGHTPQPDGKIHARFGGRVFLIDTGMLDGTFFPGGGASALEISSDGIRAIYPGGRRETLVAPPAKKAAALRDAAAKLAA
jgi:Calcineurin-like phosphoesterase